jgi:hypothetical protein
MKRKGTKTRASVTVNSKALADGVRRSVPTDEQIRCRAHEIYLARCESGDSGDELADWTAAECELKARDNGSQQTAANEAAESGESAPEAGRPSGPIQRPTLRGRPKFVRNVFPSAGPMADEIHQLALDRRVAQSRLDRDDPNTPEGR